MSGKVVSVSVGDLHSFLHQYHININSFFSIEPRVLFNHTQNPVYNKSFNIWTTEFQLLFYLHSTQVGDISTSVQGPYLCLVLFLFLFFLNIKVFNISSQNPLTLLIQIFQKVVEVEKMFIHHSTGIWIKYAYHRTSTMVKGW